MVVLNDNPVVWRVKHLDRVARGGRRESRIADNFALEDAEILPIMTPVPNLVTSIDRVFDN